MKKKKIQFSVLMSVYYKEKSENLDLSIESVMNQTLVPSEIILVEDGPLNEKLYNVINEKKDKYKIIKTIKLSKNGGLGNALNEGLKMCSYEYVARMDTDDICLENRFEEQLMYLSEHQDVDMVGSNIIEFDDETGKDLSIKIVPESYDEILAYSKNRNPFNHMTVVFKKSSVEAAGGYMDCLFFEDYFLWMRMISNGCKMYNIPKTLLRARAGLSLSNRRGSFKYISCIINFQKKLLNLGVINIFTFIYNILIRSFIALLPNKFRYYIYQKKLRNKGEK